MINLRESLKVAYLPVDMVKTGPKSYATKECDGCFQTYAHIHTKYKGVYLHLCNDCKDNQFTCTSCLGYCDEGADVIVGVAGDGAIIRTPLADQYIDISINNNPVCYKCKGDCNGSK